jgi:hypothetical protein
MNRQEEVYRSAASSNFGRRINGSLLPDENSPFIKVTLTATPAECKAHLGRTIGLDWQRFKGWTGGGIKQRIGG